MDFYELRHFCATRLLELGVSHADVALQLGHTERRACHVDLWASVRGRGARAAEAGVLPECDYPYGAREWVASG